MTHRSRQGFRRCSLVGTCAIFQRCQPFSAPASPPPSRRHVGGSSKKWPATVCPTPSIIIILFASFFLTGSYVSPEKKHQQYSLKKKFEIHSLHSRLKTHIPSFSQNIPRIWLLPAKNLDFYVSSAISEEKIEEAPVRAVLHSRRGKTPVCLHKNILIHSQFNTNNFQVCIGSDNKYLPITCHNLISWINGFLWGECSEFLVSYNPPSI